VTEQADFTEAFFTSMNPDGLTVHLYNKAIYKRKTSMAFLLLISAGLRNLQQQHIIKSCADKHPTPNPVGQ
jgi:hypothetical protein